MENVEEVTGESLPPEMAGQEFEIDMIQVRLIPPIFMASMDDGVAFCSVTDGNRAIAFPVVRSTVGLVEAFMLDENGKCKGPASLDHRSGHHYRDAFAMYMLASPMGIEFEVTDNQIVPYIIHAKDDAITLTPISLNMMLSLHVCCGVPIIMKTESFSGRSVEIPESPDEWTHADQSNYYMKIIGPRLPRIDVPTALPEGLGLIFQAAENRRQKLEAEAANNVESNNGEHTTAT